MSPSPENKFFKAHDDAASHIQESKKALVQPSLGYTSIYEITEEGSWGPHYPATYEALFVTKGNYEIEIQDTIIKLEVGQGILLRPTDVHRDICHPGLTLLSLRFQLGMSWGAGEKNVSLYSSSAQLKHQVFTANPERVEAIFRASINTPADDLLVAQFHQSQLLSVYFEILTGLPREGLSPDFLSMSKEDEFETRLHQYLLKNINEPISVDDIANAMHMSRSSLAHKCKELIGEPATQVLRNMRLHTAKNMLENSDVSVKEISGQVGFKDPYHFSKAYKNLFGVPPTQARGGE